MNDTHEPCNELEAQLTALRPVAPPAELKARIGAQLDATDTEQPHDRPHRLRFWPLTFAACVGAAACLGAIVTFGDFGTPPVAIPPITHTGPVDTTQPTLAAYRHALAQSPESLDDFEALLDEHSRTVLPQSEPLDLAGLY